jgi:hypothetical protein
MFVLFLVHGAFHSWVPFIRRFSGSAKRPQRADSVEKGRQYSS